MGQLIKLQDYVSRYETDIYKYPSRFIRLKRLQWEQLQKNWEVDRMYAQSNLQFDMLEPTDEKENIWGRVKQLFSRRNQAEEMLQLNEDIEYGYDEDGLPTTFEMPNMEDIPQSVDELKKYFLDELYEVQLLWASSTLYQKSFLERSFYTNQNLQYFLQRYPDTFLFLYEPIFLLKKAPIQGDTILLTPTEAHCVAFLEEEPDAVFLGSEAHFWEKRNDDRQEKVLNPLIGLSRTESIVKGLWKQEGIDFTVKKTVICRNGYIDYPSASYGVTIIDQRNYEEWFSYMRNFRSPLKNNQLKAAKALLDHCKTSAISRYS